jgi:large subunit ribosomal protein L24
MRGIHVSVARIKKNDIVMAIAGADSGKTGKVLQVNPAMGRVLVEGLRLVKKTVRKSQDNPQGAIVDKEAAIAASNLMLYCPACKKGVRVKRVRDGGKPVRKCVSCGHSFDG